MIPKERAMRPLALLLVLALPLLGGCESEDPDRHGNSDVNDTAPDPSDAEGDTDAVDVPSEADAVTPDAIDTVEPQPDTADPGPDTIDVGPDPGPDLVDISPDPGPDTIDAGPDDQGGEVVDFGFDVRLPQAHEFVCEVPWGGTETYEWSDADWICTFDVGATHGYVYLQSTPSECIVTMGSVPGYTGQAGWISIDGQVSELGKPGYDWGGNHHNDSISFDWQGKHYEYYHSSFGFGWRSCQNVDCLQVYSADGGALEDDGCTTDRTLPAVCSGVKPDGTWDPLVDTFEKCLGDPNR